LGETELRAWLAQHLPAVMVPSRIVSLAALPLTNRGKLDPQALPWPQETAVNTLTEAGPVLKTLAKIWSELLPGTELNPDSDFFALGGHSLMLLDLRHKIQQQLGLELPLAVIFERRNLGQLADWLAQSAEMAPWPELKPEPGQRHQAFPLSEVQQAYWIGRRAGIELGGVSAHAYLELDWPDLDLDRLQHALRHLIQLHPMLRAVIRPDGMQQVLEQVPAYELARADLRPLSAEQRSEQLTNLRNKLEHEVRDAALWPLFGLQASILPETIRLHLSFDALMADAASLLHLAGQLSQLYADPATVLPTPGLDFRDAILYERQLRQSLRYARDRDYWQGRLTELRAPALPIQPLPPGPTRFERRSGQLNAEHWQSLKAAAAGLGVTPTVLLLSLFAQVLAPWQDNQPLTLNLTTFARLPIHAEINEVVGDFTRLTLLSCVQAKGLAASVKALQAQLLQDLDHGLYSAVEVMRDLRSFHGPDAASMPVVFTSLLGASQAERSLGALADLGARVVHSRTQTPQVWLDHQVSEQEGKLVYDWDFPVGRFPEGLIDGLFEAYAELLNTLSLNPDWQSPVWQDPWPQPELPPICETASVDLLHAAFVRQALARPQATALITSDQTMTYAELLAAAWALALQLGPLAPDCPVAIWIGPGIPQAIAVLGVLLAGGAYLPLHPDWPTARLQSLLARCHAAALLTEPECLSLAAELLPTDRQIPCLAVTQPAEPLPSPDPALLFARLKQCDPSNLAYVLFTSGSTGEPKGVMIEHQAAWNTVDDINLRLQTGPQDRIFALSELNFDLSVFDLFGALAVGAALVYPDPNTSREPTHWLKICLTQQVTIWNSVPALMQMLALHCQADPGRELPDLRAVLLSGDWVPFDLPALVQSAINPTCQVYSLGGATEAAIWSIWHPITELAPDWQSVPYGKALRAQQVYVLNQALSPAPLWAPGDIYIAGAGLARGYFQDPSQSAERFIRHPSTGQRLYRTGDRGRLRPDGSPEGLIEFLGREDLQVKVQGYRIELAEIEAALARHPAMSQAVVLALGPRQGPRHLVACCVSQVHDDAALKTWLAQYLPEYMLPVRWIWLTDMPLTATGKVDRAALTAMAESRPEPSLNKQAELDLSPFVSLLQAELELPELDPDQDLMALGINSIDLVRLANQLEQGFGVTPGLGELFGLRSARALAQWYAERNLIQSPKQNPQTSLTDKLIKSNPSHRCLNLPAGESLVLPVSDLPMSDPQMSFEHWRSQRSFVPEPIDMRALSTLLAGLQARSGAAFKWLYASAGSIYPVQLYLQIRPQAGLASGAYLYDPAAHALLCLHARDSWDEALHLPPSLNMAQQASLHLYLLADLAAIEPIYGPDARDYCLLEAGAMAQLLRQQAASAGLGLCAVGQVNQPLLRQILDLSDQQQVMLSFVGGVPSVEQVLFGGEAHSEAVTESDDWEEWIL
ncbi:MAG: non-ribosomal peptide synthetase, partial [Candidatus Melainabacteria bacterium HGW-Melainabacteria-1]